MNVYVYSYKVRTIVFSNQDKMIEYLKRTNSTLKVDDSCGTTVKNTPDEVFKDQLKKSGFVLISNGLVDYVNLSKCVVL